MTVLVTVKAYPTISTKYGEAVCVAGVRLDGPDGPEWIRLFPVGFRDLERSSQFAKYQVIRLRAQRHTTDMRRETWRPDVGSIEIMHRVPAGGHWPARRAMLEPLIGPTMCELNSGRKGGADAPSLGLVRPALVRAIKVRDEEPWSAGQHGHRRAGQPADREDRAGQAGARVLLRLGLRGAGLQRATRRRSSTGSSASPAAPGASRARS